MGGGVESRHAEVATKRMAARTVRTECVAIQSRSRARPAHLDNND